MARSGHIDGLFAKIAKADRRYIMALSLYAQAAIRELTFDYWPDRINPVVITERGLARVLGCNRKTARRVIGELVERGFLVKLRKALMDGPKAERGALFRMAWLEHSGLTRNETREYREQIPTGQPVHHERATGWPVETASEAAMEKSLNAKEYKVPEVINPDDFEATPRRTYSQTFKGKPTKAAPENLAAPRPPAPPAALQFIERTRRNAENILAQIERKAAS